MAYSQGEGNNWYFGRYAGITFNTFPPSVLANGKLSTSEGCASVSGKDGVLAFYTDGITVYDANHNIMPNGTGLFGDPSSTQSSVVCPKPGTYNYSLKRFDRYYIITIDVLNGTNGVGYTEIDMTLNGGFGDVITTNKNIHLFGTSTIEGANIVKHANGCDYWIVGKEVGNNTFNVYLITSSGVYPTPVVSNVGAIATATWGSIKVAPNNKLVSFNSNAIGTQVFDFDNTTGVLSLKFADPQLSYSSEFSPNSKVLYVTHLPFPDIWQYDLTATNNTDFLSSKLLVGVTANTGGGYKMCGVQLAPNGKIYTSLTGQTRLGAIENPNILGLGCSYNDNALSIAGINTTNGMSMTATLGLPAFPAFFIFPNEVQYESANFSVNSFFCSSDSITFKISDTNSVQSVNWHIAPVNSNYNVTPDANTSTYTVPPLTSGTYKILSIVNYACFIDSLIDTITVNAIPAINLGPDLDSCTNNAILIHATSPTATTFSWNDGSNLTSNSFNTSGQYNVKVEDALGCVNSDTITITIHEVPTANYTVSNTCLNDSSVFTNLSSIGTGSIVSNEWVFGNDSTSNLLNPSHLFGNDESFTTQLIVTSTNNCKDTLVVIHTIYPIPTAIVEGDTVLNCAVSSLELVGGLSSTGVNYDYQWSTLNGNIVSTPTNDTITINQNGVYILTVTNNTTNCFAMDSLLVNIDTLSPDFNIGLDSLLTCSVTSIGLTASNNQLGDFSYNWTTTGGNIQTGTTTLTPQINAAGKYYLTVTNLNNQCVAIDSLTIGIDTITPLTLTGQDTLINCLNPSISLTGLGSSVGNYSYLWSTTTGNITAGSTTLFPSINAPGIYTLTVTNNYNGCFSSNQTEVTQNDSAHVQLIFNGSPNSYFALFTTVENEITYQGNQGNIEWFLNNMNLGNDSILTYTFSESGNYELIIQLTNAENGCIAYDTTILSVTHQLEIPGVLSPNGDGYNDVFYISALENFDNSSLTIVNRWGDPVFVESPYLNNWQGETNSTAVWIGNEVTDGTYFYFLTLEKNGEELTYKGSIEVKRK